MAHYGVAMSSDWPWADEFEPDGTYLNSATMGLPPRATLAALAAAQDEWRRGTAHAPGYDADVAAAREAYARLVGVRPETVAIGSQVSPLVALVAAAVPDGATVLVPEGEFTSVTFPFLAQEARGIRVREVPLAEVAEHVDGSTGLVALSAVQSSDGAVADLAAVEAAAARHGVDVLVDVTQAAGWLPLEAGSVRLHRVRGLQVAALAPGDGVPHRAPGPVGAASSPRRRGGMPGSTRGRRSTACRCGWRPMRAGSTSRRGGTPGWARHPRWPCSSRWGSASCTRTRSRWRRRSPRGLGWSRWAARCVRWRPTHEVPALLAAHGIVAAERAGPAAGVLPREQHA